jgi:uncharacterized protein involved in exopolysaccharide biosynthesis
MTEQQPSNYAHDEISLRDLYLIVRRGLPLIALVALLAGAAALLYVTVRGPRYQAETTVLINPTPVRIEGSEDARNLVLDVRSDVSWETYQTIAFGRTVLEDTLARLDGSHLTVSGLRGAGNLERLASGQQTAMTIAHRVIHEDPEEAVRVANAWAEVTVETVAASLLTSLESIREATDQQMSSLTERFQNAEERWAEFRARDESALTEARLEGITDRLPLAEGRLEQIERQIASAQGARQALAGLDGGAAAESPADGEGALALLGAEGSLPRSTIAELTALLRQEGVAGEASLVTLVRQVELQRLTADLAGLLAERGATERQIVDLRAQAEELRARHARLVLERDRLRQQLASTQAAHAELAALEPVISYVNQLAPTNTRVLNAASVPTEAVGPRRMLVTTMAAAVGAMLALLFVFLRAAVAEPVAMERHESHATPVPY